MKLGIKHPIVRTGIVWGGVLFVIHFLLALGMFIYVFSQRGIAQAEFAWFSFFLIDFPTLQIIFPWLGSTAPMRFVFDKGYDLVGSGPNLRAFVMVAIAGGLHWFLIGSVLGAGFRWIRIRMFPKASHSEVANDQDEEEKT
jgi:hypothetical protein